MAYGVCARVNNHSLPAWFREKMQNLADRERAVASSRGWLFIETAVASPVPSLLPWHLQKTSTSSSCSRKRDHGNNDYAALPDHAGFFFLPPIRFHSRSRRFVLLVLLLSTLRFNVTDNPFANVFAANHDARAPFPSTEPIRESNCPCPAIPL